MNSEIVKKALNIGKNLIKLTIKDNNERIICFTQNQESIIFIGQGEDINSGNSPDEDQKLKLFLNQNKHKNGLSTIHSHPYDITFSVLDLKCCQSDWEKFGINYQFVITPRNLYALYIPLNLKTKLKLSNMLYDQLVRQERNGWKKAGAEDNKTTNLNDGRILTGPIFKNEEQKKIFFEKWNDIFFGFFTKWNHLNSNQLEYTIYELNHFL